MGIRKAKKPLMNIAKPATTPETCPAKRREAHQLSNWTWTCQHAGSRGASSTSTGRAMRYAAMTALTIRIYIEFMFLSSGRGTHPVRLTHTVESDTIFLEARAGVLQGTSCWGSASIARVSPSDGALIAGPPCWT
jgi:hypothetical protein